MPVAEGVVGCQVSGAYVRLAYPSDDFSGFSYMGYSECCRATCGFLTIAPAKHDDIRSSSLRYIHDSNLVPNIRGTQHNREYFTWNITTV